MNEFIKDGNIRVHVRYVTEETVEYNVEELMEDLENEGTPLTRELLESLVRDKLDTPPVYGLGIDDWSVEVESVKVLDNEA